MVYGLLFQVSLLNQHLSGSVNHLLGSIQTDGLDRVDNPLVNLIAELVQIDVFISLVVADDAEYVDGVLSQHRGQLDVQTALTDSQAHLLGLQIDLCLVLLGVQRDAGHLGGRQGTLDEELRVVGEVDDVDVLVAELTDDAMNAATLHTNAGSYRIDAVVVALDGNLGTLTRHTGNAANSDQTVLDFGNLSLQQTLEELVRGTAQDDARIVVFVLHLLDDGANGLALVVVVRGNLLLLGQVQLVALVVDEQHFALPHLVHLGADHLTDLILILII